MTKVCNRCREEKALDAFPARDREGKAAPYCRACRTEWARGHQRIAKLRSHGVAEERIPELLAEAEMGRCHACERPASEVGRLHVDHDHATGLYRGLLCKACNTALGLVEDGVDRLVALAMYLLPERDLELMK